MIKAAGPETQVALRIPVSALAAAGLLVALAVVLGDALFSAHGLVGRSGSDLAAEFFHLRRFGFESLAMGRWPFWDGHLYAGVPFFANPETALLYPLNLLHLVFSTRVALNLEVTLALGLHACFAYAWARHRRLGQVAASLTAALGTFGGAVLPLATLGGNLSTVDALAWVPAVLLLAERLADRVRARDAALLIGAVGLQAFAGQPQVVYNETLALAILLATRPGGVLRERARGWGCVAGALTLGLGLAAVQLVPTIASFAESARAGGGLESFSEMGSLPPAALIKLFVPDFFGAFSGFRYWGQTFPQESTVFIGATGLVVAAFGWWSLRAGARARVAARLAVWLVLALGAYTPVHHVLVSFLPLFGHFRGSSKFAYFFLLELAWLAGLGFESARRARPVRARFIEAGAVAVLAVGIAGAALAVERSAGAEDGRWRAFFGEMLSKPDTLGPRGAAASDQRLVTGAGRAAASETYKCALTLALLALALGGAATPSSRAAVLAVLLLGDVMAYAWSVRASVDVRDIDGGQAERLDRRELERSGGRVLLTRSRTEAPLEGVDYLTGSELPVVPGRFLELLNATQGDPPGNLVLPSVLVNLDRPIFRVARLTETYDSHTGRAVPQGLGAPLPRVKYYDKWRVLEAADARLKALASPDFEPDREVVLDRASDAPLAEPGQAAESGAAARSATRVIEAKDGVIDIETEAPRAGVLLVTESFSRYWTARSLDDESGLFYRVVPADHAFRGIVVPKGRHRLRLEYSQPGLAWGIGLSLLSLLAWLLCVATAWRRRTSKCF